jgi:hypothetical protein
MSKFKLQIWVKNSKKLYKKLNKFKSLKNNYMWRRRQLKQKTNIKNKNNRIKHRAKDKRYIVKLICLIKLKINS